MNIDVPMNIDVRICETEPRWQLFLSRNALCVEIWTVHHDIRRINLGREEKLSNITEISIDQWKNVNNVAGQTTVRGKQK